LQRDPVDRFLLATTCGTLNSSIVYGPSALMAGARVHVNWNYCRAVGNANPQMNLTRQENVPVQELTRRQAN